MKLSLSILCVTKAESFAIPFLCRMNLLADALGAQHVVVADGAEAALELARTTWRHVPKIPVVRSNGFLESVLDHALTHCDGEYILRLDDDEQCSPAMEQWLLNRMYTALPHWKFPRAHLVHDQQTVSMHPQLWPDHQTRLSIAPMAGGRRWIHAGSPFGGGEEAPCVIEHHKFLVKTLEERKAIAARYDSVQMGAGTGGMLAFNCPELGDTVYKTAPLGSGEAALIR